MIVVVCSFFFSGCALYDGITNYFNSTDHFLAFKQDQRIMLESGAENFASAVAIDLPLAIEKVESQQYSKFPDKITITADFKYVLITFQAQTDSFARSLRS